MIDCTYIIFIHVCVCEFFSTRSLLTHWAGIEPGFGNMLRKVYNYNIMLNISYIYVCVYFFFDTLCTHWAGIEPGIGKMLRKVYNYNSLLNVYI